MDVVFRIISSTGRSCFEAMDITVMICSEHVDTDIKTALALIDVLGGI
jgi:hypothetical protein